MWTVTSIRNWQELSLPGSPPNSCEPRTSGVVCPTNVPCFDRLRHWFDLCWTWKEDNMVNAGTDRSTIDACRWTKGSPRCCNEHNWDDCHTSLWQNQHLHQGARRNLFPRNNSVQQIPPTRAALEEHVKRAVYQDGHLCGETLLLDPVLPSPTDWRVCVCVRACVRGCVRVCVKTEGIYEPHWTTLPQASKSCHELISCGSKSGCRKRCMCKKDALQCTGLCFCVPADSKISHLLIH